MDVLAPPPRVAEKKDDSDSDGEIGVLGAGAGLETRSPEPAAIGGQYRDLRRRVPQVSDLPTHVGDMEYYERRKEHARPRREWPRPRDVAAYGGAVLLARGTLLAERVLPEWFTRASVEENSDRWQGAQWISERWRAIKWPLACTAGVLCVLVASWWLLAPVLILNLGFTSDTLFKGRGAFPTMPRGDGVFADGDEAPPPGSRRVDAMGVAMENPLPLCDLLYSRREHATHRDELAAALSRRIAAAITNSPERAADDGVRLFKTNVPDHRHGARWSLFEDHEAVRPELPRVIEPLPIALNKLSEEYQEAILNRRSPHAMGISITRARKLFHSSTVAWLRRECARHHINIDQSDPFAAQVAETGAFTVNATDYIAPTPPREPRPSPQAEAPERAREEHETWTRDNVITEVIDIYSEEEDEPEARAPLPPAPTAQEPVRQLLLLPQAADVPQEPQVVLRNVSAYELHALMFHMAAQARDVWVTKRTHVDAAIQIGAETVDALVFGDQGGERGADAMRLMARQQAALWDEGLDPLMAEFRSRVLWTGEMGCVCPHHIGVPIPGAAWTEMARPSKKTLVLFYPRLSPDVYARKQQQRDEEGVLTWLTKGFAPAAERERRAMAVAEADPVFGAAPEPLEVPYDPQNPWTWVEGLDFRGQRQRLRVSPTSLACIMSCNLACSDKINTLSP